MEKLYANYHKLELRPPKEFVTSTDSLDRICQHLGHPYNEMEDKSQSESAQYRTTETYRRLIDFHFTNSSTYGKSLDRVEIHGEAYETLPLDVGSILTKMEIDGFFVTEVHSRILLPPNFISWATIDQYFNKTAYTAGCNVVSQLVDPRNGYAKTWQAGKRPARRSAHSQGKRLIFYEAHKIHPELPEGTTTMELQLFGDTAHKFIFSQLTRNVDLTMKTLGVVRKFFEFKTIGGDSNKSRRPTAGFWKKVIGNYSAIHLPRLDKPEPQLKNQIAKFHQELFAKEQKLSRPVFAKSLVNYIIEHGFTNAIAEDLTPISF